MKEEALNKYNGKVAQAAEELYDDGHSAGYEEGFAKGQEGVEPQEPVEDVTPYDQAYVDQKLEEQKQVDAEILETMKGEMSAEIQSLKLELSQKDIDTLEETIADRLQIMAQELRDRTVAGSVPQGEPEVAEGTEEQGEEDAEPKGPEDAEPV